MTERRPLSPAAESAVHHAFRVLIDCTDDGPERDNYVATHDLRYPQCFRANGTGEATMGLYVDAIGLVRKGRDSLPPVASPAADEVTP